MQMWIGRWLLLLTLTCSICSSVRPKHEEPLDEALLDLLSSLSHHNAQFLDDSRSDSQGVVVVTAARQPLQDFVGNWACSLRAVGLDRGAFVLAMDYGIHAALGGDFSEPVCRDGLVASYFDVNANLDQYCWKEGSESSSAARSRPPSHPVSPSHGEFRLSHGAQTTGDSPGGFGPSGGSGADSGAGSATAAAVAAVREGPGRGCAGMDPATMALYNETAFNAATHNRLIAVVRMLRAGYNVLLTDSDIVFFENPLLHIPQDVDIVFQGDQPPSTFETRIWLEHVPFEYMHQACGGFMFF
eukprot:Rmarinus@m.2450